MEYQLSGELWRYESDAAWYFITLPKDLTPELKAQCDTVRGFGSIKVQVDMGEVSWRTSIFPDTKSGAYLLPVKKDIRKACNLKDGSIVSYTVTVLHDI